MGAMSVMHAVKVEKLHFKITKDSMLQLTADYKDRFGYQASTTHELPIDKQNYEFEDIQEDCNDLLRTVFKEVRDYQ